MKAIVTKYHGPTNTRGSRISASDLDGNRVFFSLESQLNHDDNHAQAALALCKKMGWKGELVNGSLNNGQEVFVWDKGQRITTA